MGRWGDGEMGRWGENLLSFEFALEFIHIQIQKHKIN